MLLQSIAVKMFSLKKSAIYMTIDIENGIGLGCYAWADLDSFKDFRMNFISWLLSTPGTGSHFLCNSCECFFGMHKYTSFKCVRNTLPGL